jgi:hypothetical protein
MAGPWEAYKKKSDAGPWTQYQRAAPQDNWSDLPGNVGKSAMGVASGLYQAVRHPLDTLEGIGRLGSGAVNNMAPEQMKALDAFLADRGMKEPSDQREVTAQRELAGEAGKALKNRYGGLQNIKHTLINDPVGSAMDASLLFGGGAAVAGKASTAGKVLGRAAEVTNPLTLPMAAARKGAALAGKVASYPAGLTTGAGPASIQEAGRTGAQGGEAARVFRGNMRGSIPPEAVIDEGKAALGTLAKGRHARYMAGMEQTKAAAEPVDVAPIAQELQGLRESLFTKTPGRQSIDDAGQVVDQPGGVFQVGTDAELAKMNKIEDLLREWQSKPGGDTPIALDALKRRISRMAPAGAAENSGNELRLITGASGAVKDAIVKQVPSYAAAMKDYESSTRQIQEIEKTLKLGGRASNDQALRALQSIFRNNANTNYGSRVKSGEALAAAGGKTIMPALAGQMLNSALPRGLSQLLAGGAGYGAALSPMIAAALPMASPRIVGEIAHALGRASRKMPKPDLMKLLAAAQAGKATQPDSSR